MDGPQIILIALVLLVTDRWIEFKENFIQGSLKNEKPLLPIPGCNGFLFI
jgi:hypothetical protein